MSVGRLTVAWPGGCVPYLRTPTWMLGDHDQVQAEEAERHASVEQQAVTSGPSDEELHEEKETEGQRAVAPQTRPCDRHSPHWEPGRCHGNQARDEAKGCGQDQKYVHDGLTSHGENAVPTK